MFLRNLKLKVFSYTIPSAQIPIATSTQHPPQGLQQATELSKEELQKQEAALQETQRILNQDLKKIRDALSYKALIAAIQTKNPTEISKALFSKDKDAYRLLTMTDAEGRTPLQYFDIIFAKARTYPPLSKDKIDEIKRLLDPKNLTQV